MLELHADRLFHTVSTGKPLSGTWDIDIAIDIVPPCFGVGARPGRAAVTETMT